MRIENVGYPSRASVPVEIALPCCGFGSLALKSISITFRCGGVSLCALEPEQSFRKLLICDRTVEEAAIRRPSMDRLFLRLKLTGFANKGDFRRALANKSDR
jgi:hypothetical protein